MERERLGVGVRGEKEEEIERRERDLERYCS